MKKSFILFIGFLLTMLLLSGCQYIKDKIYIEEETESPIVPEPVHIPTEEEVNIPKIDNMHYFGYEVWENVPSSVSSMKISHIEFGANDTMYFPLNFIGGIRGTKSADYESSLREIPRSVGTSIDENSGIITDLDFQIINKTLVDGDHIIIVGASKSTGDAKIACYELGSYKLLWEIQKEDEEKKGIATDIIKATDGNYVYVANYLGSNNVYYGRISKVTPAGELLWYKHLSMETTYLYLDKVVEGKSSEEFLALGHIYDDLGYKVYQINQGDLVRTLDLNYIAEDIRALSDGNYFVMGVSKPINNFIEKSTVTPVLTKINSDLEVSYIYSESDINRLADFVEIGKDTYLFVGNYGQDIYMTVYFDNQTTLIPIKSEVYKKSGVPTELNLRYINGKQEFVLSGYAMKSVHGQLCEYSFISYLHTLNAITKKMYEDLLNNNGEVRYLIRGEQQRRDIALAIAASEGNDKLMYIRYLKSDGNYAFAITGKWDDPQIITQYLLQNNEGQWSVLKSYEPTEKCFEDIKTTYPDLNPEILPPVEMASYTVRVLSDEELQKYKDLVAPELSVKDITFSSYIDEYLYLLFADGSDYFIVNPDSAKPIINEVNSIDYYNFYLIDEENPPYMIFMQD